MWFHLNGELFGITMIPCLTLVTLAFALRRRRGLGVFLAIASSVLFLFSEAIHWLIYQKTQIPLTTAWQEGGVYFYGLAMSLYQAFPLGLLYLFARCSDTAVKKQGHVLRGRFNPHELPAHNGKRWIALSAVSFILPIGLLTGPWGVTHTWWRMHLMDMGKINPRGRGMLALAQVVFAMSWLSGYFLLSVAICGFHFYSAEILSYFGFSPVLPPFLDVCIYYFPTVLLALSFWQAMAVVAIYRYRYSPLQMVGQLCGLLLVAAGIVSQVMNSLVVDGHVAPSTALPVNGIWITLTGWCLWLFSLCGVHRIPELETVDTE